MPELQKLGAPCIDIQLVGRRGVLPETHLALLDTGADWSTLPESAMGPLGVTRDDCDDDQATALGLSVPSLVSRVPVHVVFQNFHVPILPVFAIGADKLDPYGAVLGRSDFFRWFRLEIDVLSGHVALHPHPDTPTIVPRGLEVPA